MSKDFIQIERFADAEQMKALIKHLNKFNFKDDNKTSFDDQISETYYDYVENKHLMLRSHHNIYLLAHDFGWMVTEGTNVRRTDFVPFLHKDSKRVIDFNKVDDSFFQTILSQREPAALEDLFSLNFRRRGMRYVGVEAEIVLSHITGTIQPKGLFEGNFEPKPIEPVLELNLDHVSRNKEVQKWVTAFGDTIKELFSEYFSDEVFQEKSPDSSEVLIELFKASNASISPADQGFSYVREMLGKPPQVIEFSQN